MVGGNSGAAREMAVVRKQKSQWEAWNFILLVVGAQAYNMIPRTGKLRRGFWSGFYELWIGRYFEITKKKAILYAPGVTTYLFIVFILLDYVVQRWYPDLGDHANDGLQRMCTTTRQGLDHLIISGVTSYLKE